MTHEAKLRKWFEGYIDVKIIKIRKRRVIKNYHDSYFYRKGRRCDWKTHTQGLWCYINVLLWLVTDYADVCSIVILWGEYRFLEPGWEKHCPRPSKWIHQKLKIPHHYFPHIWFSHFGKRIGHQYSKMSHQPRGKAGLASHHLLSLLWANLWGKNTHSHFHRDKSQYINSACYLNPRLGKKYFSIRTTIVQMRFFPQKKKEIYFSLLCTVV